MKIKVFLLTFLLTLCVASTVLANDEGSKAFYAKAGVTYLVTGDSVRVRTHPTTDGYIICELNKGAVVKDFIKDAQPHEDSSGMKWRYILMEDGHVGWVSADFIESK